MTDNLTNFFGSIRESYCSGREKGKLSVLRRLYTPIHLLCEGEEFLEELALLGAKQLDGTYAKREVPSFLFHPLERIAFGIGRIAGENPC